MPIKYLPLICMLFSSVAAASPTYPYIYEPIYTFSAPGASSTEAHAINNNRQVGGSYSNPNAYLGAHGFIHNLNSYTAIDAPDVAQAYGGTNIYGINNNGSVVGSYTHSSNVGAPTTGRGFIYNGNTYTTIDAASLNGFANTDTYAYDINDNNQVAGTLRDYATGALQGFLYSDGALSPINVPNAIQTTATGINNLGQVVGYFSDAASSWHGYIYDGDTYSIFDVSGSSGSYFYDINNNGLVIGEIFFQGTHSLPFIRYTDGNFSTLSHWYVPEGSKLRAYGINDNNYIVGAVYERGTSYGFLAMPVPIPAAAWTFGFSLIGLISAASRRNVA